MTKNEEAMIKIGPDVPLNHRGKPASNNTIVNCRTVSSSSSTWFSTSKTPKEFGLLAVEPASSSLANLKGGNYVHDAVP